MASGYSANGKTRSDLDFAGFAQEFVRRNPAYIRDYRALVLQVGHGAPPGAQEVMARRWGLCFSVRA